MKKNLLLMILPFALVACGPLNNDAGVGEESLNGNLAGEYNYSQSGGVVDYQGAETGVLQSAPSELLYAGPRYYVGSPYKIEDIQYTPTEDYGYNQTGTAGIVPVDLNGAITTNGEQFNTNAMHATSKILPLPSIARITNLENGQSAVVRINNRGPFVNSRLLDVSPTAARKLGMMGQVKVQVQILETESRQVKKLSGGGDGVETASVTPTPTPVYTDYEEPAPSKPSSSSSSGIWTVQIGAYYSEDSANSIASRVSGIGNSVVVEEGGLYKVRFKNLSADEARQAIQRLRSEENMAPGLLKNGKWTNIDSL